MRIRITTIVGARPQFVKAAMVSRQISLNNKRSTLRVEERIVHTGQHYDQNMSDIFFEQLGIPEPDINLKAGTGTHGAMTGKMLAMIEKEILKSGPDCVLVYGDTNSTLAGALAAVKLHVPVAHVEAGLRSFNRKMPEEINRILTDHVSSFLFCPTRVSVANLAREGIVEGVSHVGDVMHDAAVAFEAIAERKSDILIRLGISPRQYYLATVHRAENTDDRQRLESILAAFQELDFPVILPVHPRTRPKIADIEAKTSRRKRSKLVQIEPVSFLDMVRLEKNARVILTDSGGVQKEAYFQKVPCVTLREETEWEETVGSGWNQLVGADFEKILSAVACASCGSTISEYGDGKSSEQILQILLDYFQSPKGLC